MKRDPSRASRLAQRRHRGPALSADDLRNLLESTDVATVCIDPGLRIKWFTPAARGVLDLRPDDIGRPIGDLGRPPLAGSSLDKDARAVMKRRVPLEVERRGADGRFYLRRTLPYRSPRGGLKGVIINFYDLTETRRVSDGALAAEKRTSRRLGQRVDEDAAQLRWLAAELTLAEEREREAIARDLHDNLAQLLHVMRLKLAGAARDPVGERTAERLRELDALTREAESVARSLVFKLVPPVLAELGLVPALQWLGEEMQRTHDLAVEVRDDGAAKALAQSTRTVVYRAVRELLINVAKHAQTDKASIEVCAANGDLRVAVLDGGRGFDAAQVLVRPPKGLGLVSVRERIHLIGGKAEIRSVPGDGTKAELTVPLDAEGRRS